MSEPIAIIVTLFEPEADTERTRLAAAKQALKSWKNLKYDGEVTLILVDDGSQREDYAQQVLQYARTVSSNVLLLPREHQGVGASLNIGILQAREFKIDVFAYLVDDWVLDVKLDINSWVRMLCEDERVGMVRIGTPHPDLEGVVRHSPYGWYLELAPHHYAFGFRPALYHQRMIDHYGWFEPNTSSWNAEMLYNQTVTTKRGLAIALALPDLWHPLYPMSVGELEPANVR